MKWAGEDPEHHFGTGGLTGNPCGGSKGGIESDKNDDDPIGKLMHDFRCTNAVDMFYPILASQVRYFKETEGGREKMCKAIEDAVNNRMETRRIDILTESLKNLMESMRLTADEAMTALKISEDDKKRLASRV